MNLLQESAAAVKSAPLPHWNANPIIFEINTWVWLRKLSCKYDRVVTLADVPPQEIEDLASWGFDAIWLMGVWHRGHAARMSALDYLHEYRHALPDVTEADVPGSAYAIRDYQVERQLGGREGLAIFREQLRQYGIKLILDFVPNHVAIDHHWTFQHPEYFIGGTPDEAEQHPADFFRALTVDGDAAVIARGRDPHFPAWIDTAQLNAFHPGLRQAVIETLIDIGSQCDGVRCDMAMLPTNAIFAETWNGRADAIADCDYWLEVIPAVREVHPQMLFMAEVYWNLEHRLQLQGFNYTYDKRMYDRLLKHEVGEIKDHLRADLAFTRSNIRFIENHDEPRAMETLGQDRQRPAAALICTLPGAVLLHQGQMSGRRIKLPVQISRQADEPRLPMLERFYRRLLREVSNPLYHSGNWQSIEPEPISPADHTNRNLIAYTWKDATDFRIIVVNLGGEWSRAVIDLANCAQLAGKRWLLVDALNETFSRYEGDALYERGLQLEAPPYGAHIFRFELDMNPSGSV